MISQIEVCKIQLDQAIRLFLDEKDYVSSCTLAGAAEGLTGEILKNRGCEHALASMVKGLNKFLTDQERDTLADRKSNSEVAIWNDLILVRNWLKHHYKEQPELQFDEKEAAFDLIDRAVTNYFQLTSNETDQMRRFLEYQSNEFS